MQVVSMSAQSLARSTLDASASYINDEHALICMAQTGRNYRVVVCLRNQFARAVPETDYEFELLASQSLPERVLYELRHLKRFDTFPHASVLIAAAVLELLGQHAQCDTSLFQSSSLYH